MGIIAFYSRMVLLKWKQAPLTAVIQQDSKSSKCCHLRESHHLLNKILQIFQCFLWINLSAFDKVPLHRLLSDCLVLFDKVSADITLCCTASVSLSSSALTFLWKRCISQTTPLLLCFVVFNRCVVDYIGSTRLISFVTCSMLHIVLDHQRQNVIVLKLLHYHLSFA